MLLEERTLTPEAEQLELAARIVALSTYQLHIHVSLMPSFLRIKN